MRVHRPRARQLVVREEVRHLWSRLRTHLPRRNEQPLRLAFCATHSGEGTTSVATNFSILLAEQGLRTCLVEGNLRRPSLARLFGVRESPGLSEYLEGSAGLVETQRPDLVKGLTLLPAGSAPDDAFLRLSNGGPARLLDAINGKVDAVVVDCPPLSTAPEVGIFLSDADVAVLVVQCARTRYSEIARSTAIIREAGIALAGVLLNRVRYDLPFVFERLL